LNADPCHLGSLRVLLRVSRERLDPEAIVTGLGIARALGIASPIDLEDVEAIDVEPCYGGKRQLSDPLWEKLRQLVQEAAPEIAATLDTPDAADEETPSDPIAAFHAEALAAEGQLTARALLPLTNAEHRELIVLLAALVLDPERVRGDGHLVNAISSAIKRRQRRKLRKHFKDTSMESTEIIDAIDAVDFEAWREEVRALAGAVVIDEGNIDLRDALIALSSESSDAASEDQAPSPDLTAWVAQSPKARALLRQATRSWLNQL